MQPMENPEPTNFGFLAEHDPLFVQIAFAAEKAFSSDPNTTLIKLRQLGEALAQHIAALAGIEFNEHTTAELDDELNFDVDAFNRRVIN